MFVITQGFLSNHLISEGFSILVKPVRPVVLTCKTEQDVINRGYVELEKGKVKFKFLDSPIEYCNS